MRNWDEVAEKARMLLVNRDALVEYPIVSPDIKLLTTVTDLLGSSHDDEQKALRLRHILVLRWHTIASSSMDYTIAPHHPVNQFYFNLAKTLQRPDENLCHLLMPGIRKVLGSGFPPEDVTSATFDFALGDFLTCSADRAAMIAIPSFFAYATLDTDRLFLGKEKSVDWFDITAVDRERLRLVAGPVSECYFSVLEKIYRVRHQEKPSVGWAVSQLSAALLKSSKTGTGSENLANYAECKEPILRFYRLWKGLSPRVRDAIKDYKSNPERHSLESHLVCLFVHAKEVIKEIEVSDAELDRVVKESIFPCAHQMGNELHVLLSKHADLSNFPIPGMEADFESEQLPTDEEMAVMSNDLESALKTRKKIIPGNDTHFLFFEPMLEVLLLGIVRNGIGEAELSALSKHLKKTEDLLRALYLLPCEMWQDFFRIHSEHLLQIFFPRGEILPGEAEPVFTHLLQHLPSAQWKVLFEAMYEAGLETVLDSTTLGILFSQINESLFSVLAEATEKFRDLLIVTPADILNLLSGSDVTILPKVISFFKKEIEDIFSIPKSIGELFGRSTEEYWLILYQLFHDYIRPILLKERSYDAIFSPFYDEDRNALIAIFMTDADFLSRNPVVLIRLLRSQSPEGWANTFRVLGVEQLHKIIPYATDLFIFLDHFESGVERNACIRALSFYLPVLDMKPVYLCQMMRRYPDCEKSIFLAMRNTWVDVFCEYFQAEYFHKRLKACVRNDMHRDFIFLIEKVLPHLMSDEMMGGYYADLFSRCKNSELKAVFDQVDRRVKSGFVTPFNAALEKCDALSYYMSVARLQHQTDTPLYRQIKGTFGEYFFTKLLRSSNAFLEVNGVGLSQAPKTKVANVERTHGKRASIAQAFRFAGAAAAASSNPSFEVRGMRLFTSTTDERAVHAPLRNQNTHSFR